MHSTFVADFVLIATSSAVTDMLMEVGVQPSAVIRPGLDFDVFSTSKPIGGRTPGAVGFPWRSETFKGTADALEALALVRGKYPSLQATALGHKPRTGIPPWLKFIEAPDDGELSEFYNGLSIFVLPSHFEGWGLPGMESQACGVALVASDCVGIRDYAKDQETALLVTRG